MIARENEILNVTVNKTSDKVNISRTKTKRKRGRPRKSEQVTGKIEVEKNGNDDGKVVKIKTLEHDIKGVVPVLENCGLPEDKNKFVIGDSAYLAKEKTKKELSKKGITLIAPYRKNQKKVNTKEEKKKLKNRNLIERKFSSVKQNNRIHVRKDRKIVNFIGFFYLGTVGTF
jgi:hypothetical protein